LPNQGQEEGDIYDTGLKVVVPGTDSPLKKGMFADNVEFLTLPEFQDWLKKYNLTGS
jgi:ribose transport system substrate-binding protein